MSNWKGSFRVLMCLRTPSAMDGRDHLESLTESQHQCNSMQEGPWRKEPRGPMTDKRQTKPNLGSLLREEVRGEKRSVSGIGAMEEKRETTERCREKKRKRKRAK